MPCASKRPSVPRLVHRLDKDTSGVLLIARNAAAAAFLTRAFREKTTRKIYWAVVVGLPKPQQAASIWRSPKARSGGGPSASMPMTRAARAR